MATAKPFRAIRPRKDLAAKVAAPPYDVLSTEEARAMAQNNPYSFLHINKPEIDLEPGIDPYDERVYRKGAENFRRFLEAKILFQDDRAYFYVYQQQTADHRQIGLVACASVEEYEKGIIKKHELTRPDKENDRVNHILHLKAQVGPVFLMFKNKPELEGMLEEATRGEPEYDFEAEGVRNTVWVIRDEHRSQSIQQAFEGLDTLYVADGHHRSAAAMRVKQHMQKQNPNHTGREAYNYFLSVIFPHTHLKILDYNRVVRDLNGLDETSFLDRVREPFQVEPLGTAPYRPAEKHQFGMYLAGRWYRLTARPGTFDASDPVDRLDVSILQQNLLEPILGIHDPRQDKRIDFIGGIRGLEALQKRVDHDGWAVAFALYPTAIEDLIAIADAGKIMPPKSTWFEPKLRSGLFIHSIAD